MPVNVPAIIFGAICLTLGVMALATSAKAHWAGEWNISNENFKSAALYFIAAAICLR